MGQLACLEEGVQNVLSNGKERIASNILCHIMSF